MPNPIYNKTNDQGIERPERENNHTGGAEEGGGGGVSNQLTWQVGDMLCSNISGDTIIPIEILVEKSRRGKTETLVKMFNTTRQKVSLEYLADINNVLFHNVTRGEKPPNLQTVCKNIMKEINKKMMPSPCTGKDAIANVTLDKDGTLNVYFSIDGWHHYSGVQPIAVGPGVGIPYIQCHVSED